VAGGLYSTFSQRFGGPAVLVLCGACIGLQVLARPAVGIANNGDFAKMAGTAGLGPEDGTWELHQNYSEFLYRYMRADRYVYNRDFRSAAFLSSEFFLVKFARVLQKLLHPGLRFDIRWLGAVNAAVFLLAIGIWIYAIPARWGLAAGLLLLSIWTDVAYVQYLNSFYMDTAAMIFLILCAAATLHAVRNRGSRVFPVLAAGAGFLFATSKAQHAIPGLALIPLFLGLAWRTRDGLARTVWIAGSFLLAIGSWVVLGRVTGEYRSTPLFNVVFYRLAPQSPDPLRALHELGMGPDELRFLHSDAYSPGSPVSDPGWVRRFETRCNYATLLHYYFRHSSVAARFLYADLSGPAVHIRPWANLSADDGFPPGARATHFTWWTDLRSFLLQHAPWHVALLALAAITGALWLMFRSPADRAFAALVLAMQTIAAMEYGIAVLADAAETDRHLFVFHVATEITILLMPALAAIVWRARRFHAYARPSGEARRLGGRACPQA
jgi:hypothetical protein